MWRESIYQEIFEEKSLPKDLWKNHQPNKLGEKNLPKQKSEEKVFTKKSLKKKHYQKLCEKISTK